MTKDFALVAAMCVRTRGIGRQGSLPWRLPSDMRYFRDLTQTVTKKKKSYNAVIMGRVTWESIPERFRPLPDRLNIVLTRDVTSLQHLSDTPMTLVCNSIDEALEKVHEDTKCDRVFVIGGASVYEQAMQDDRCAEVYLTEIDFDQSTNENADDNSHSDVAEEKAYDAFFPNMNSRMWTRLNDASEPVHDSKVGASLKFAHFARRKMPTLREMGEHEERQYLSLVKQVVERGVDKGDRTGTGVLSLFGAQMRFSLRDDVFPLLTSKRVFWKGVVEELLWFVRGCTNARTLADKGVHIWDGNGSREFLDSRGLGHREEGDLGPVYGFQWRHFGADYTDMHADYSSKGVDQLAQVLDLLRNNPESRRIILTAWNPAALREMALPPCHMFAQFFVAPAAPDDLDQRSELSCQMYQRSCDLGLGVPFNIASYALLTRMIAHMVGMKAGEFVHTLGDAHVYKNHVVPLRRQLRRVPRAFPKLTISRPAEELNDLGDFHFEDFKLEGYKPHPIIKMSMAV